MTKIIIKTITEQQWRTLKSETLNTIVTILESIEILIDDIHKKAGVVATQTLIGAGLLSHAIEEYGKLLYLQSLLPINGMVTIEYDGKHGAKFKNHTHKFELALKCLPKESKILHEGNFGSHNFGRHNFDVETIADWNTRLNIFNTDLNDDGSVKKYPIVYIHKLETAVVKFRKIINNTIP
jgi:hypothetical protein